MQNNDFELKKKAKNTNNVCLNLECTKLKPRD